MKRKWLAVCLLGLGLSMFHSTVYATVLDRPTLFMEILKQNEQLSDTAVMLMNQYLENPSAKDLAELKCLFRKMIGDSEREYLALNGFTIDDFISGLDAIAQIPIQERKELLSELDHKAYERAHQLLVQYDSAVIIGQDIIPLTDGSGKAMAPTNAKADFESMLKSTYEKSSGLHIKAHWASDHVQWLTAEKGFNEALLNGKESDALIGKREFLELLTCGFPTVEFSQSDLTKIPENEPIQRIDAMQLLFEAMPKSSTVAIKSLSGQFSDVQLLSESQQACVLVLVSNHVVKGYNNGTLKPNQALSFGEAWAMIRLALD